MVKYIIFLVIGAVIGYYIGNKQWRDKVNSWVKAQLNKNSKSNSSKGK